MRFGWFLILMVSLQACSTKLERVSEPENIISRDTMVMLLKDLTLIESHIQNKYLHVSRFQKTMILSGDKILDKYHVSRSRFETSMDYYGSRQAEMRSIYTEILDSLNKDVTMLGTGENMLDSTKNTQKLKPGIAPVLNRKRP